MEGSEAKRSKVGQNIGDFPSKKAGKPGGLMFFKSPSFMIPLFYDVRIVKYLIDPNLITYDPIIFIHPQKGSKELP